MLLLFELELSNYLKTGTTTSIIVDSSRDGEYLQIDFNISFPALSCEFAAVDVSDILGTHRFNITKTVRKFPIDAALNVVGPEVKSNPHISLKKHGEDADFTEEAAVVLTKTNFEHYANSYPILAVNFYAPWCHWSARLKPSWEKAAHIMSKRYDPKENGKILLGKVDCTQHEGLCKRHHVQGYPSIRIFRHGQDVREDHGHHEHESYSGERDAESLVLAMEAILDEEHLLGEKLEDGPHKQPAPHVGGCRIDGFVKIKKVPGTLLIGARSSSHSFDVSAMNLTHTITYFSFGRKLSTKMLKEIHRLSPYSHFAQQQLRERVYTSEHSNITHEHYLQVVKNQVISLKTSEEYKSLEKYEYTAQSNTLQTRTLPVVKFHYELSPLQVLVQEKRNSFSHFVTNLCAIIGGVFTVAGIIQSMLQNAIGMVKKVELGKHL